MVVGICGGKADIPHGLIQITNSAANECIVVNRMWQNTIIGPSNAKLLFTHATWENAPRCFETVIRPGINVLASIWKTCPRYTSYPTKSASLRRVREDLPGIHEPVRIQSLLDVLHDPDCVCPELLEKRVFLP